MKFYVQNFNGVLDDVLPHLEIVDDIDSADKLLLWQDIKQGYVEEINIAHKAGKEVIQVSHCFGSCNDYCHPQNHTSLSDKILVWGEHDYNLALQAGIAHKVVITGSPIFNHRKERIGGSIVYSPTHFLDGDRQENFELGMMLEDCGHVITKLIDGHNPKEYPNPVVSDRQKEHIDICFDVLSKADVVVTNDRTSTFSLLAMSMDIPVVFVNQFNKDYGLLNNSLRSATYETTLSFLPDILEEIKESDSKKEQRRLWATYCGAFIKNPLENILKEL